LAAGDRSRRSDEQVDLPICTRVQLATGVRRIDFETTVNNQAEDHRLRVHLPTPIVTDQSWAEGHFDVIERPIAMPLATETWREQPTGAHPQRSFVDLSDGQCGVLLANRGLPEYEVLPAPGGSTGTTLALTLLRCVGWLSRGDLHNRRGHAGPGLATPEAQCPGTHTFHYALVPHSGNYLNAQREAHAFNAPLRAIYNGPHPGRLPSRASFVQVSPTAAVLTAAKAAEDGQGLIVRLYNSAPVPIQAHLKLWQPCRQASLVALDERDLGQPLASDTDAVAVTLRPRQIATLRFVFGHQTQER
jgi:alpha-mannosidase